MKTTELKHPEKGRIEEVVGFGRLVHHGCASLGEKPLSGAEIRLSKSKCFSRWPIERVERHICRWRLQFGVDHLYEKQARIVEMV